MGQNKIEKSIVISYISIIFTLISGLLYTPWLIKELGTSNYAIYSIATSLVVYFTIDFGIGAAVTRIIAKYHSQGNEEGIGKVLGLTLKLYFIIDLIIFIILLILFFFINNIYQGLTEIEIHHLKVVYSIIGMMTIFCIPLMPINGVYIAYERIYNVKFFDLLTKILTIILVCSFLYFGYGLYSMVLINALLTIFMNYFKLIFICYKEKIKINLFYKNNNILKEILFFSSWVTIAMIADKFFFSIEPSLLGAFSNSNQVAIFAIAAQIEGYVLLLADGLNGIFLPKVTDMIVKKESSKKMTELMIKVGRLQLIIVTFLILGIIVHGKDFIMILFGKEYIFSYYVTIIILIPCFIHLTQGIAMEVLLVTGNIKYKAFSYCIGAVVNVGVTIILAPYFGAMGGAVGIALSFIIGHEIIMNIIYKKKLKLDILYFFKNCHLKMLIPAIIALVCGLIISKMIIFNGIISFFIKCFFWSLCYSISIWLFYIKEEEKEILKNLIYRMIKKEKK